MSRVITRRTRTPARPTSPSQAITARRFRPFVFKTYDYGETWSSIASNLTKASANVLVEDRKNPSLLFLGTDHGLFVPPWTGGEADGCPFQSNMPVLPVRDLVIHPRENDLVVGTHGRGAFVTDVSPLQQLTGGGAFTRISICSPPEPKGLRIESGWGNFRFFGWRHLTTPNEPNGVLLDFHQNTTDSGSVTLRIKDSEGATVRTLEEAAAIRSPQGPVGPPR